MRPPNLTHAATLNFIDGAVTLAAALTVSIILARSLGPDRFGLYALTMSIVMVGLVLARLGISSTVKRFIAELHGKDDRRGMAVVTARGLRLGFVTGTLGSAVLVGASAPMATFFGHPELTSYLVIGGAMVLPMVLLGVLRNVAAGLQRYQLLMALNLATSPLWLLA